MLNAIPFHLFIAIFWESAMLCYKTSQPEPPHSSLIKSCHLRASGWPPLRSRQCHLLNGCIISNTPWDCPLCRRAELAAMRASLDPANWQWIFSGKPRGSLSLLVSPCNAAFDANFLLCPHEAVASLHNILVGHSTPRCLRAGDVTRHHYQSVLPIPCGALGHTLLLSLRFWGCSSEWKHMRGCLFTSRPILQLPFNELPTSQSAYLKSATLISPVLLSFCVSLPVSSHNNLNF